jgi:hypothetical protein
VTPPVIEGVFRMQKRAVTETLLLGARFAEAAHAYEQAIAAFETSGNVRAAARATSRYGRVLWRLGEARYREVDDTALAMLDPSGPCPELVDVLAIRAGTSYVSERHAEAIAFAERDWSRLAWLSLALSLAFRCRRARGIQTERRPSTDGALITGHLDASLAAVRSKKQAMPMW